MELKELETGKFKVIREGKNSENKDFMIVRAPWIKADSKNKNGRIYSRSLLEREIARIQDAIEKKSFIGSGDHAPDGKPGISTASHIVEKIWLEKDGRGMAQLRIIPTSRGRDVMELIKNQGTLGLSPRGFGEIINGRVQDDYQLAGLDIVLNPSEPSAIFSSANVLESVDFAKDSKDKETKKPTKFETDLQQLKEFAEDLTKMNYDDRHRMRIPGEGNMTLEEYHQENYPKILSMSLRQHGFFPTDEYARKWLEKTNHLQESSTQKSKAKPLSSEQQRNRLLNAFHESVVSGFNGDFEQWKSQNPQLVEYVLNDQADFAPAEGMKTFRSEAVAAGIEGEENFQKYEEAGRQIRQSEAIKEAENKPTPEEQKALDFEAKREAVRRQVQEEFRLGGGSKISMENLVFKELKARGLLTEEEKNFLFFREMMIEKK